MRGTDGGGRIQNTSTFLFYSAGNDNLVYIESDIAHYMLSLACTGLLNFQDFCEPDDIRLVV